MPSVYNPTKPKTSIDEVLKYAVKNALNVEKQVIVHCKYIASAEGDLIRIWPSTFLCANDSTHESELINTQKISIYPNWTLVEGSKEFYFTLIFSGLPKSCKSFNLIEKIPEPGGFLIKNISRNNLDVYNVEIV